MLVLGPVFRRWAVLAYAFGSDWIWVLLVIVVLFGGSQLPRLAKNAGEAMKEFRKAHDEATDTSQSVASPPVVPPAVTSGSPPQVAVQASVAAPSVPQGPPQPPASAVASSGSAEQVTLSRSELDALLAVARERAAAQTSEKPEG
jgi:sec-independent protein translocase protein TatA